MTRRTYKKIAKRYLNGGDIRRYILGRDEYRDGDYGITEIIVPDRLRRAIYTEAYRRGWDGNHWDDPLITSTWEGAVTSVG